MQIPIRRYIQLLLRYIRPQWKRATLLAVLLLSSIAMQLVIPQILRYFIDTARSLGSIETTLSAAARAMGSAAADLRTSTATSVDPTETLLMTALLFLAIGLANQVLATMATYIGADVGWRATNLLRSDLTEHALGLDMSYHNDRTPGEMIERIDGDVTALTNFFSQFVVHILGSALLVLGVLAVLWGEDVRAGAMMTLFAIVASIILYRTRNMAVEATTREREATSDLYGFLEERLAGIDDIRANGAGRYVMRRMAEALYRLYQSGFRAWVKRANLWVIIILVFALGDIIAFGLGIYLFRIGVVTLGTVYLFFQYTELIRGPLEQITQQLSDLQRAGASIGRVDQLLATRSAMLDNGRRMLGPGALTIEFDHVGFAYDETPILHDLSFRLEAGRTLGLLGRTGSGKTSLTRLLLRLYDPTRGSIRIDGVDLRDLPLERLRSRIAMVTQEVQLFHASLRDNLTYFDPTIPDERIREVIDELGLGEWFASLGEGLDTELAPGGTGLSAGEAQLLSFTRIFLKDPGIVILDEPSSRMDLATQGLLERALERLLDGRTAIIIAHRLSTVSRADDIMILERGSLREHGDRRALEADPTSRYHALLQAGLELPGSHARARRVRTRA